MRKLVVLWHRYEWWLIGAVAVFAYLLGTVGMDQYMGAQGVKHGWLDAAYRTLTLAKLSAPNSGDINLALQIARWLVPGALAYASIKAIAFLFQREVTRLGLTCVRNHSVVFSDGPAGDQLVHSIAEGGETVVLVTPTATAETLLRGVGGSLYVVGKSGTLDLMDSAGLSRAKQVFVLMGDSPKGLSLSLQIANHIGPQCEGPQCEIYAQVLEPGVAERMARQRLGEEGHIRYFNLYARAARLIHDQFAPDSFQPVRGLEADALRVLLIGCGRRRGQALLLQWAQMAHYANRKPLQVDVIDNNAVSLQQRLIAEWPALNQVLELTFHDENIELLDVEGLKSIAGEKQGWTAAYICLGDEGLAWKTAGRIEEGNFVPTRGRIVICLTDAMTYSGGQPTQSNDAYQVFSVVAQTCTKEQITGKEQDQLARIAHDSYLKTQISAEVRRGSTPALVEWEQLPDEYQTSNRHQADHIKVKLRAVGCVDAPLTDSHTVWTPTPDEVEKLAEMEHRRWMAEKRLAGWSFGLLRDDKLRQTPLLVDYERLSEAEKDKDRQSIAAIDRLLSHIHRKIIKAYQTASPAFGELSDS